MTFQHRGELRADPGIAPGDRNIDPPKRRSIWPSIAVVAAASAFGGVIWYAYHQSPGAGGNGVPLVKAESGPVKIKPDNPGGQDIPYQDSTVYDRLNQNGQKPVAEKLLPPPEQPATRTPPQPVAPPPEVAMVAPLPPPLALQPATPLPPPLTDAGAPTALAPTPGAIVIQPPPPPVLIAPTPKPAAIVPPKPEPAPKPVPTAKPVPAAKPTAPNSIAALIDEAGAGHEPPAAKSASGGGSYRLQLSAVRSPDAVAGEWARLKRRYPELASMSSSTSKITMADKGTVYRIEAGPLDEAAAKSTCSHLREQGLGCIAVKR